jgi:hypothetical protein
MAAKSGGTLTLILPSPTVLPFFPIYPISSPTFFRHPALDNIGFLEPVGSLFEFGGISNLIIRVYLKSGFYIFFNRSWYSDQMSLSSIRLLIKRTASSSTRYLGQPWHGSHPTLVRKDETTPGKLFSILIM